MNPKQTPNISLENIHEFIISNDRLIYEPTGEIIDSVELHALYLSIKSKLWNKDETLLHSGFSRHKRFTRLFHVAMKDVYKINNPTAIMLFMFMCSNLQYRDNKLVYNNTTFISNDTLSKLMYKSKRTIISSLKLLEDNRFIIRVGKNKSREIYINPSYAFNGDHMRLSTYLLFNNS